MSEKTYGLEDILKIQSFSERMAERLDKQAADLKEQGDYDQGSIARARAEAFWVIRNYIQDSFIEDWSDETK